LTIYKCQVNGLFAAARTWSTAFHVVSTDAASTVASTLDAAWNTLWTTATNGYEHLCNSDVSVVNTRVYTLNATFRTIGKITTPRALAGTNVADSLPPNIAPIVGFLGALDEPSDRGRMKFPPPSIDQFANIYFTDAFGDSLEAVLNPFFATMHGLAGYRLVTANAHTNKLGEPPWTLHDITAWNFGNKCGTVNRRQRKTLASRVLTGTV